MLQFPDRRVITLVNFQARNEVHGKDLVPAVDLTCSVKGSNRLLDLIHPQLRAALFKAGQQDSSTEPELDLAVSELPHVRVPKFKMPISLDYEQTGMTLEVAYGTGRKPSNIVLGLVKCSKVKIEALAEGGSVEIRFVLSCANEITEQVAGKFAMLQGHDIEIALTGPVVEEPPIKADAPAAPPADPGNDPAWPFPNDAPAQTVTDSAEDAPTTPEEALLATEKAAD